MAIMIRMGVRPKAPSPPQPCGWACATARAAISWTGGSIGRREYRPTFPLATTKRCALLLGLTTTLAFAPGQAEAGWTQPAGSFYFKIWDQLLIGRRVHLATGGTSSLGRTYQDHGLRYYFELGVTDDLTAVVRGNPLGFAKLGDESTLYSGMLALGVRYAILRDPLPISIEAHYGYAPPLGDGPLGSGIVDGQPWVYLPTIERHQAGGELLAGYALSWGWLKGGTGLRFASAEGIDPVFSAQAGIGARSSFGLTGELVFSLHHPLGEIRVVDVTGVGQTRYVGFNLSLSWWLSDHFAVNIGGGGAFYVRSNAATPSFSVGIELH
jgi:hypothetical protein